MLLYCIPFHIFLQWTILPFTAVVCCHFSEVVSAHMGSGQGWQQAGSWIVLPWMVVAVPGQTCQLGWHQCSDSWFGTRSGRQRCKCVCVCFRVWCYLSRGRLVCRVGGTQRLGKQEIVGPSRLILPTLLLSWHIAASCCGHGMAASEARWRAWTSVPGTTFTYYVCVGGCVVSN